MQRSPSTVKVTAAAAAVSAALVVAVYEGRVLLAGDTDNAEMRRGDGGEGVLDRAVVKAPDVTALDLLSSRIRQQAEEIRDLRAALAEYEGGTGRAAQGKAVEGFAVNERATDEGSEAKAKRCAASHTAEEIDPDCSFFDPDPLTLQEMARCAALRVDAPAFLNSESEVDPYMLSDKFGLDEDAAFLALDEVRVFREDYVQGLKAIYLDLGGNPEALTELNPPALQQAIVENLDEDEFEAAARRRAEDLAGLSRTAGLPENPLADRYVALVYGVGDDFEAALATAVGPTKARELRAAKHGWEGERLATSGHCLE